MGRRRGKPNNNSYSFEKKFKSYGLIAGTDEVGVGCLAGPLVAAAVILDFDRIDFRGIIDSKRLKPIEREELYQPIIDICIACSWYKVEPGDVNELGPHEASILAMQKAVEFLEVTPGVVLVDHHKLDIPMKCVSIDDGDNQSISIAAASILAKVRRDRYMKKLAKHYPGYKWETNVGYGTADHQNAILKLGLTKWHRKSYCKKFIKEEHDTEDKGWWTIHGSELEEKFVGICNKYLNIRAEINPEKKENKYAPDLLVEGKIADLKTRNTPFFTSEKYKVDPRYAVTFNRKDYERYKEKYPDIDIYFWIHWTKLSYKEIKVKYIGGIYKISFPELQKYIESGAPEHFYHNRVDDKKGNAKSSFILDIRKFIKIYQRDEMS